MLKRLLLAFWVFSACTACAAAELSAKQHELRWIDRPWEYRYLLHITTAKNYHRRQQPDEEIIKLQTRENNLRVAGIPQFFEPTSVISMPLTENERAGFWKKTEFEEAGDALVVVRIDVAPDRTVITHNSAKLPMTARLNWYENIVLAPAVEQPAFIVEIGRLFLGSVAASDSRYLPSICNRRYGDSTHPMSGGRYSESTKEGLYGYFGCREWAAQLYDHERPYIDVTSYEMAEDYDQPEIEEGEDKGHHPLVETGFVRDFIGFSRFKDAQKPVIGSYIGTWFCFTDCPDGEAPGVTPDIKAWSARRGWPMPEKPADVREFKDTPKHLIDYEE